MTSITDQLFNAMFGRVYKFELVGQRSWKELDFEFKVTKTADLTGNKAELKIINLNEVSRKLFKKGQFIKLEAGYKNFNGPIFNGATDIFSHKKEDIDWVTTVTAVDGLKTFQDVYFSQSFSEGATEKTVIEQVARKLRLDIGKIEIKDPRPFNRGVNVSGWFVEFMQTFQRNTGSVITILDGKLYCIPKKTTLPQQALLVNKNTGMLGSPTPTDRGVKVRSLLRYDANPTALMKLQAKNISGEFIITKVKHDGSTFSDAWYSDIEAVYRR